MVGWVIAMIAAACLCASAWLAERTLRDRLEVRLLESDVAAQIQNVEAFLGPQARDRLLLDGLTAETLEGRTAMPSTIDLEGPPPW
jgi:hypothetical protein